MAGPLPRLVAALCAFTLAVSGTARAQTWTGATDTAWGISANWSTGVPGAGNTATFNGAGNGNIAINLGGVARPIGAMLFDTVDAAAYSFSGNAGDALLFDAGGTLTINTSVTANQTFNNVFQLAGAFTATNNGTGVMTFNGTATLAAGGTQGLFTIGGTGNSVVTSVLGNGAFTGLTKTGTGQLVFSTNHIYTGTTTISGGSIRLTNATSLQNSTVSSSVANGVVFDASAGTAFTVGSLGSSGALSLLNTDAAPITLTLGTNNANVTYSGTLSGVGASLIKVGTGTQTMSGNQSSYTGNITINQGTLAATNGNNGANSSLGARITGRTITVNTGGTLRFNTNNIFGGGGQNAATLPNIIVNNGGTFFSTRFNIVPNIQLNGALMSQTATDGTAGGGTAFQGYQFIGTVTVGGSAMSTINTTNGKANHLRGGNITIFDVADATGDANTDLDFAAPLVNGSGDYAGVGSLTKNGVGTMRLSVANANTTVYSGATVVNAGAFLAVPTAMSTAAVVTVADGATFGAFNAAAASLTVTTLNIGATAGGRIRLELAGNATIAPLTVTGTLVPSSTLNKIDVGTSVALTVGQFPLIAYPAGGIGGSGFGGFSVGNLPARVLGDIVNNTTNSTIDLNVTGTDSIRWNGNVNGTWDINSTPNWFTNTAQTSTTYLQPSVPGEPVLFNDLAAGNFSVNIPSTVNPASVTVDNTANNYTFSGATIGPSGSFTFTKTGNGTLTILNDNTFGGTFTINGGSVVVGNGGTNGSIGTLPTGVLNNGSLTFNKSNNLTLGTVISGSGSFVKAGAGTINVTIQQTYTGGTTVDGGTLTLSAGNNGTGAIRGVLTINAGGTVLLNIHDAFGYNAGVGLTSLNIVGGTIDKLAGSDVNETLTGVAVNMTGGLWAGTGGYWDFFTNGFGDTTLTTTPSPTTATISTRLNFRSTNALFTVPTGTTPSGTDLLISGALTGPNGLIKEGSGKMVLTGISTYTGPTAINLGTVQLGDGTNSGALGNTAITNNASILLNPGPSGNTIIGGIAGTGMIQKIGPNMSTLGGVNTYTGDTLITAGTLRFKPTATTAAVNVSVADGARLTVGSFDTASTVLSVTSLNTGVTTGSQLGFELINATTLAPLAITTTFTTAGVTTVNVSSVNSPPVGQFPLIAYPAVGGISGAGFGGLTLGTLPLRVLANLVNNTANNTVDLNVTGTDTIRWQGGVNGVWNINSTPNWRAIVSNTDTTYLQPTIPGDIVTFNDLATGTTTVNIPATVSPASLTVDNSTLTYTFTGVADIAGAIQLVKSGTGILRVANNNTFTGGTLINAGTVIVGNGGANGTLGTGDITNNGSIVFNHSNDIAVAVAISGTGSFTQAGPGTLTLSGAMSYTGDTIVTGGTLSLPNFITTSLNTIVNGGTLMLLAGNNGTGNIRGTLTINTGGTVLIGIHDAFGYANAATTLSVLNINGGTIDKLGGTGVNETLTGVTVNMTGGILAGTGGYWDMFQNNYGNTNINTLPSATTALISASLNFRNESPIFTVDAGNTPSGVDLLVTGLLTDSANGNTAINGFTKLGLGKMLLTGTHNYRGTAQIDAGTLQLGDGTTTGVVAGSLVNNATVAFNPGPANQIFALAFGGTGSVIKLGPNTLTLSGVNSYGGSTTIAAGTLRVAPNQLPTTSPVTVQDGARLTVFNATATPVGLDSLNLGTNTGGIVNFELAGNTTVPPIQIANAFSTVGVNTLNVLSSQLFTVGQFPLILYSSAGITGSGFAGLTLGSLPLRVIANLVDNSANLSVDLNVTGIDIPRWNGNLSADWDINTTLNWRTVTTNVPTTYLQPTIPGDNVLFNDQAVGNFNLNIVAAVSPTSVTVNNTANNYTFSGAEITGATGLTKSGTGSLTLLNNNTYTGTTTINSGTLFVGNGGTTGSLGTGPVVTNASLVFNRTDAVIVAAVFSGTGTVTMAGTGSLNLTNLGNSFSGNLVVASGTLIAANALNPTGSATSSLGAMVDTRSIIVNAGATLSFPSNNTILGGGGTAAGRPTIVIMGTLTSTRYNAMPNIVLNGGLLTQASTDPAPAYQGYQFLGSVTVTGIDPSTITSTNGQGNHLNPAGTTFDVADVTGGGSPSLYVLNNLANGSNDYPGTGSLTKTGLGEMLLAAANAYSGDTNINAGTLTVNGSIAAGGTVFVNATGTLAGRGAIGSSASLVPGGVIRLTEPASIGGTLAITGGTWNGQGTVGGAVSLTDGTFTLPGGASLRSTSGVTWSGGTIAGTGTLNGSLTYTHTTANTFAGIIAGTGDVTVNGTGELILSGANTYTGLTTVSAGTLTLNNALSGPGGAITIADGATLNANGVIQRSIGVSGANSTGVLKATGNLSVTQLAGTMTFDGHLNTQGHYVQLTAPGDVLVRTLSMSNGAVLTTGTAIKLANNLGGASQGDTGVAFIDGSVTISGTFWAGRVTDDSALFIGAGNPSGDKVTFTGILRGSLNNAGVDVVIQGLDRQGWSPTFGATSGADFAAGSTMIVVNSTTKYSPNANTWMPTATGGGYTQRLVAGYVEASNTFPGTYTASASTSYIWDSTIGSGSHYDAATAQKGDSFSIVRTDGSAWGVAGSKTNIDGSIVGSSFITLPNGTSGGSAGSFQNLPTLPVGLFWHVDSSTTRIQLYVGGFLPFGDGVWKNGNGNGNWTMNSAPDNNWGGAQPFAASQIATFDSTVTNFGSGAVNLDAPQTIGGLEFNRPGAGYTIGTNGGNVLTLDNGPGATTIHVGAGNHTIAAPIALNSNLLASIDSAADTLTLSGGLSGSVSLTKAGLGTVILSGTSTYTGTTTINAGTLRMNNALPGAGGAIAIADSGTLQASGSIQRVIATSGVNQTGTIQAVGNLTITQLSGTVTFNGHLNTQSNVVQYAAPGDVLVRTISMGNGATLTSGTAIKLANNLGGASQGDTGVAYIDGNVTIGGTFWAGRVTDDSSLFIGAGNPGGDKVTFTGILRGSLNNAGVDLVIEGLDRQGWSPVFGSTSAANTTVTGTSAPSFNTTTQYTPNVGSWPPTAVLGSGGHTQRLVAGVILNGGTPIPGTYTATATTTYQWNPDSTYNVATAVKGDTFTFVRTDGSLWGTNVSGANTRVNIDGSVIGFEFITLPNGTTGGSSGDFQNLPALTIPGQFWHVDATVKRIALYVGGFLPYGSGVWKNGGNNGAWTQNTAVDNNWGTAQPFWAGNIATFDASVVNYAGGVVNVDAPQMLGGLIFNKTAGGYTVGGSLLTLDNGAGNATIQVILGSHAVTSPIALTSNLLVTVDSAADVLTVSGPISGLNRTLTKAGPGTLALNGTSTYSGATTVTGGTLGGTGTLAGSVAVTGGRVRGDVGTGVGTLTMNGLSVGATGGIAANLGASGTNSKLAIGGGILNLATNSTLQLTSLPGFGPSPASYTLASNAILQLDGNAVPEAFPYGSYTQGVGPAGPVVIDVSQFGFTLAPGDTLTLSRAGNDLVLSFGVPIPEPVLLILAGVALLGCRRGWKFAGSL